MFFRYSSHAISIIIKIVFNMVAKGPLLIPTFSLIVAADGPKLWFVNKLYLIHVKHGVGRNVDLTHDASRSNFIMGRPCLHPYFRMLPTPGQMCDGNDSGCGEGAELTIDTNHHCEAPHSCCRDSFAWNSRNVPPLHPVSGRFVRWHITTYTSYCKQLMISTL